ncbi:MAG: restriction endonuclease subunit S, partial [bacterium]
PTTKLPKDWSENFIENICKIRDNERIPLNSKEREDKKPGNIPYYGANGKVDEINDFIFDGEFILLAEDGGHFEEFRDRPVAYKISGKAWVNNHAHVLEVKNGRAVTDWVFYSLEHKNLIPYISGGTRPKLNKTMLQKVKIPLPPKPEQRKIASVLYTVDQAIQKTEEIIEQTKRVKKGLMQDFFGKFTNSNQKQRKSIRLGPKRVSVPTTWDLVELESVGEIVTGDTPSTSNEEFFGGELPFVTPDDFSTDRYIYSGTRTLSEKGRKEAKPIPKNSIMMECIGMDLGKVRIAGCELATNQQINSIIPYLDKINHEFLYYQLVTFSELIRSQAGKTRTPIVNKSSFGAFEIVLPPLKKQNSIVNSLKEFDEKITIEQRNNDYLKKLKKGLMQDLLTGEVRTNDKDLEVLDEVLEHG